MSSVVLSGDSSGTVTLTVPSAAGTNTATLPAATGTVMVSGNMPAFYAWAGANTSLTNNTWTKVLFNTSLYDTNSNYSTSTSRFTPTVAGYYQINSMVSLTSPAASAAIKIYKNGSAYSGSQLGPSGGAYLYGNNISSLVYMNGSTDYIEIYFYQNSSVSSYAFDQSTTWVNGYLARTA